ncbi:MAG: DUF4382 domain-containing protein [Acidobacteriota bacterium]
MKKEKKWFQRGFVWAAAAGCVAIFSLLVVACGSSSGSSSSSGTGTVNTQLSDPATCEAPAGPFSHVYVTITDVQANTSATASSTDSGWVDLTPNLSKSPQQIDLLGQANNQCFLATLGDAQQLQAGSYQQIRLMLADNSTAASLSSNQCGNSAANCVVLGSDNSVHALQLSSESKTGIKIPSGQIAGGNFTIAAGQTKDLDIDFSTCESIVAEGNGQYRLKPVLHAGEVSTTSTSINGKILDNATGNPVSGTVMIAVEQKDSTGVDRVQRATLANADGSFVFCPLPSGTYDVVIVGTRTDGSLYEPAIVSGVSVGSTVGTVNLFLPTVTGGLTATTSAKLNGTVTSQNGSNAGTIADIDLSVLETVNGTVYTIPLPPTATQSSATLSLETGASSGSTTCASGTDCVNYSFEVPTGAPYAGAWSSSGATLAVAGTSATYVVDGNAFVQGSGGTSDCSPSELKAAATTLATSGQGAVTLQALAFMQCQ